VREEGLAGSFWPDPTQRALLEVALGPREDAAARWQALQPLEVSSLPTGGFAVLPLLYERLAEVAPDEPQLLRLAGTYRSVWFKNQLLFDKLAQLLPKLWERGADALLVGGAAAARRWYDALGSRPAVPLELVVRPADVSVAAGVLVSLGWRSSGLPFLVHTGAPPALAGSLGPVQGYRMLRSRAEELEIDGATALVLDSADSLLFCCATGARTVLPPSVQWLIDAHRIVSSDAAPAADLLVERARELRLVEPLRATLHYLTRHVATPGADRYLAALGGSRGSLRERVEFALMGTAVGRTTAPAQLVAAHLRANGDEALPHILRTFPRYLVSRGTARRRRAAHSQAPPVRS
jgi:putative nucleotidyltransferase-like protein